MHSTYVAAIALIIIIIGVGVYLMGTGSTQIPEPTVTGPTATYANASVNDITLTLPFPGAVVGKQFSLIGEARGYWYFEASFPAELVSPDGTVLWQGPVSADGEWMTTDFVPFKADVVVSDQSYIGPATLILKRDNPSGEPENDASLTVPIVVEY